MLRYTGSKYCSWCYKLASSITSIHTYTLSQLYWILQRSIQAKESFCKCLYGTPISQKTNSLLSTGTGCSSLIHSKSLKLGHCIRPLVLLLVPSVMELCFSVLPLRWQILSKSCARVSHSSPLRGAPVDHCQLCNLMSMITLVRLKQMRGSKTSIKQKNCPLGFGGQIPKIRHCMPTFRCILPL